MYFMYFLASLITGSEAADPSPPPPYAFANKADLRAAVVAWDPFDEDAIATYGPIADWDVSAITDMSQLFSYDDKNDPTSEESLQNFDSDISSWDTSGVTTMSAMFQVRCFSTSAWITSHPAPYALLSARQIRRGSVFNQPLSFDTSSVTDMCGMFMVRSTCALGISYQSIP